MNHPKPRRRQGGFTLIELLVAIAILGILGSVAIKELWSYIDESKQTATKAKLKTIHTQIMMFKRKHNELPRDLQTLLEPDPRHQNTPWLEAEDIRDAWGNEMVILDGERAGQFEVVSYGENGVEDGFDAAYGFDMDISSTRPLFAEES